MAMFLGTLFINGNTPLNSFLIYLPSSTCTCLK